MRERGGTGLSDAAESVGGNLDKVEVDDTSQIARFPLESKVKMLDKWAGGTSTVCSHTRIQGEVNVM